MAKSDEISDFVREKLNQIEAARSEHPIERHADIENVYLATSDWIAVKNLKIFLKGIGRADVFVNCGIGGLNFLSKIRPSKIIFIDINKFSLSYYLYLTALIKLSKSRAEFISFYYSKDTEKIELLLKRGGGDREFNAIPSDPNIFEKQLEFLKALSFPESLLKFKQAVFNAKCFVDYIIPAEPLDQERKLYLFKSDFDKIYAPHPVSFFMNLGWLEDESAFNKTRESILKSEIDFLCFNLVEDDIFAILSEEDRQRSLSFYISNIGSTIPLGREEENHFKNKILAALESKIKDEKKKNYYRKILYQFYVLRKFVDDLLRLNEFTLITQFGVFDKKYLLDLKNELLR